MGNKYRRYKNIFEKFLDSNNGRRWFNVVYSVGAAIVILGAMFKLLHLPFGNLMLMIGMITEAIVFLLSALEKPDKDYKWEEVYPVLADDDQFIPKAQRQQMSSSKKEQELSESKPAGQKTAYSSTSYKGSNTQERGGYSGGSGNSGNNMMSGGFKETSGGGSTNYSNIPNEGTFQGTGSSNQSTNNTPNVGSGGIVGGSYIGGSPIIVEGSNVTEASERYANQLNKMTENMTKFADVTNSLGHISETLIESFKSIVDNSQGIGNNTQGYINQLDALNRNIAGLNTIYEIQLKGVSGQINTIEEINAGLDRMKKLYSGSLVDSSLFKNETEKMAKQLTELNSVYARLLQAMTTNMNMGGGFNTTGGGNNNNPQP